MTFIEPALNATNPWPYLLEIIFLSIYSLTQYSVTLGDQTHYQAVKPDWAPSHTVVHLLFGLLSITGSVATSISYVSALTEADLGATFVFGAIATIVNVWSMWKWQFWFFGEKNYVVSFVLILISCTSAALSTLSYFMQESWVSGGLSIVGVLWLFYLMAVNASVVSVDEPQQSPLTRLRPKRR